MPGDEVFEQDDRARGGPAGGRLDASDGEEARQNGRHLDDAEAGLQRPFAQEHHPDVEALVAHLGERVPRVDRDGGQDREDFVVKARVQACERLGVEVIWLDEDDPRVGQRRGRRFASSRALRGDELVHPCRDGRQLLGDGHPVRRCLVHLAGELLLEAREADHEELVEVARYDRVKLQPLEQRNRLAVGLGQAAGVELEPRELSVQIEGARPQVGLLGLPLRRRKCRSGQAPRREGRRGDGHRSALNRRRARFIHRVPHGKNECSLRRPSQAVPRLVLAGCGGRRGRHERARSAGAKAVLVCSGRGASRGGGTATFLPSFRCVINLASSLRLTRMATSMTTPMQRRELAAASEPSFALSVQTCPQSHPQ